MAKPTSNGNRIPGLKRRPEQKGGRFDDLPRKQRDVADWYLRHMIDRRRRQGKPVTGWVLPILVGQARRLARNPPTSAWGRSMRSKLGGYRVQERYRAEGRDATAKASRVRQQRQGKPVKYRPDYPERERERLQRLQATAGVVQHPHLKIGRSPNLRPDAALYGQLSGRDFMENLKG